MGKHKTALNTIAAVPEELRDWELLEIAGDIFVLLKDSMKAKESYLKALEQNNSKSILLKLAKIYVSENQLDQSQILFSEYTDKYAAVTVGTTKTRRSWRSWASCTCL